MIVKGVIDTTLWITHRLSLGEVPARFAELPREKNCIKAIIEMPAA